MAPSSSDARKMMSKILIIGGTGKNIGRFIVAASVRLGHPTFALVRTPAPADPVKAQLLQGFKDSGVTLLQGDLHDHESLVKAMKQVDVVISTVGFLQLKDQIKIIDAIKEAGNVKRFLPSEFGNDVDRVRALGAAKPIFELKSEVRRAVEASGIPYTFVSSNFLASFVLPTLGQPGPAPADHVVILGDGNVKAVIMNEDDIGTYTIRAVDDPRTLNKILYLRPHANILTHNELVSLWEKKLGKTFKRIYLSHHQVLKHIIINEAPSRENVLLDIFQTVYLQGVQTNFQIEPAFGVEASELYPDVKYTTVYQDLDRFIEYLV